MDEFLYRVKRNCMDVILIILAIIMLVFCCDIPVIKGFEIFDHTGKDFLYDIYMAMLTAIIFYFLQKQYTHFVRKRKYEKIVYYQCQTVAECIKSIICMITKENDYDKITVDVLNDSLQNINFYTQGSACYMNNKELILIHAIIREDKRLLQTVEDILEMPFIDNDLLDILYGIKTLSIHKTWEEIYENENGHIETIKQGVGESWGGIYCRFDREKQITTGMMECVDKIKEMNLVLKVIYGYTSKVKL